MSPHENETHGTTEPINEGAAVESNEPKSVSSYVPQYTHYQISEVERYVMLLCGSVACFLASYSYAFGLFASTMSQQIGHDMTTIATVGTVMLVFSYFTLPYAFLFEMYGPTPVLIIATVLLSVGCLLLALMCDEHISPSTLKYCIFTAIMGGGSIVFDLGNIVSVMSWFPIHRGPVVAVMKSFAGLGSAVLGCWQLAFFGNNDQTGNLFYLMMGIAIFGGVLTISVQRLPPYHIPTRVMAKMSAEEIEDRLSTKVLFMKKPTAVRRLYYALGVVIFLVFFLPIQTCIVTFGSLEDAWKIAFAVVVMVALAIYPAFCLPVRWFGGMDEEEQVHEEGHAHEHTLEEDQQEVLDDVEYIAPQYQTTFAEGLCTLRLWCIFASCFTIVGSQLVVGYYYVFIAMALRGEVTDEDFRALLASLNGVGSAVGRLFLAWYEHWSQNRAPEDRQPITACLLFPSVFTMVGLILWIVLPGKSLAVGHFVLALGNGSGAAAAVLIFRGIFAKEPAKHYNFAFLSSMVAAVVLNRVAFAEWYSKESYHYFSDETYELVKEKYESLGEVPPHNTLVCMKKRCVLMPMILMIGLIAISTVGTVYLHVEYALYCKDILAARAAVDRGDDDVDPDLVHKHEQGHPADAPQPAAANSPEE